MHYENEFKELSSSTILSPDDPETIRRQIKAAQADLFEKLGDLGDGVQDKVVETVESFADQAKLQLKEAFDVEAHTQRRPLTMLGASIAVGFLVARALSKPKVRFGSDGALSLRPSLNSGNSRNLLGRNMLLEVFVPVGLSLLQYSVKNRGQKPVTKAQANSPHPETEEADLDDLSH